MSSISDTQIRNSIREILKNADLSALSSKTVRKQLEEKFHVDFTERRQEIDDILMSVINSMNDEQHKTEESDKSDDEKSAREEEDDDGQDSDSKPSASASKNGLTSNANSDGKGTKRARSSSDSESGSGSDSDLDAPEINSKKAKPPAKKRTGDNRTKAEDASSNDDEKILDDEAFARELQQQELRTRQRSTKQKVEKKPKTTKAASGEGTSRKKGNSLYTQECVLSPELAAVMGTDRMARKDVVSRMWKIFKERDLIDPKKKQYVICDEQLQKIFKAKKFKAFGMMKVLKNHIKDAKLIQS